MGEKSRNIEFSYLLLNSYPGLNLTIREAEFFYYFIRGKTAKETAALLCISNRTVEAYQNRIKEKLEITNIRHAIELAVSLDLYHLIPLSLIKKNLRYNIDSSQAIMQRYLKNDIILPLISLVR